jgi:hypothetical protein
MLFEQFFKAFGIDLFDPLLARLFKDKFEALVLV